MEIGINCRDVLKRARTNSNGRQECRARRIRQQTLLTQPQNGLGDIEILGQRLIDQRIQRRIIPAPPPLRQLGIARSLGRCLLPLRWRTRIQSHLNRRSAPCQQ